MSFLIDPALLYSSGRTYGQLTRSTPHAKRDAAFGAATMALFWGVSIPLYLDQRWTRPIWRACRARSGSRLDAQLGRDATRCAPRGSATHAISARDLRDLPVLAVARCPRRPSVAAQPDAGAPRHASSSSSASGRLARPKPTRTWTGSS